MPYYIARVQLRNYPSGADYTELHKAMATKSFLRVITIGSTKYHLPDAEYAWDTALVRTVDELVQELKPVIATVHNDYLLLISRADSVAGMLVAVK